MDYSRPSDPSPSRLNISHPYPPSYRSSPSASPMQHQMDYQRRRDERHAQQGGYPAAHLAPAYSSSPYDSSSSLYIAPSPDPQSPENQPLASMTSLPTSSRLRAGSDSSLAPVLKDERPEGWTKEDEEAEREFMRKGLIDWQAMRNWRFFIRKEWWYYYVGLLIIIVLATLMTVYHDDIVTWLKPVANWMKDLPAGWVIPIAVMFVISFPPLFGHEIVAILVGAVWGLWIGFGIVAAGTFLGEVGNFYAFKYCLRSMAQRQEKKSFNYACMAHVVREGGFLIIFMARLSAIPGHFTTAVFSMVGVNIWLFLIATVLTLPKQLVVVYLGVIFEQEEKSTKDKLISYTVVGVGFLATIAAAWYIYREMDKARLVVWRRQRMALAAQGVSMDPVTGQKRQSFKERPSDPEIGEQDESRSPILLHHQQSDSQAMSRPGHASYQSYRNPYDIQYRQNETMSVYDVDPPNSLPEQDIGYTHPDFSQSGMPSSFPSARPTGPLRRADTKASAYTIEQPSAPAEFPMPSPAPAGSGPYAASPGMRTEYNMAQVPSPGIHPPQGYSAYARQAQPPGQ